jgi:hypothetical protein
LFKGRRWHDIGQMSGREVEDYNQVLDVLEAPPAPDFVAQHDAEHVWRTRGERAIRAEMERRIARRLEHGRRKFNA